MNNKQFVKILEKKCDALCVKDPDNCNCFDPVTQVLADDLGIDIEDMESIETKEECICYQDVSNYDYPRFIDTKNSVIDMIVEDRELSNNKESATEYVEQSLDNGKSFEEILMSIASQKAFKSIGIEFN